MTDPPDTKFDAFRRLVHGHSRVLALSVKQLLESNEPEQRVTLDLLNDKTGNAVRLNFEGVQCLKIADIHPGTSCYLSIRSIAQDQLERLTYKVTNGEQDFTLSLLCANFDVQELRVNER